MMNTNFFDSAAEAAKVNDSVESAKRSGKKTDAPKRKRKRSMRDIICSANKRFDRQFYKSNAVKLDCLKSYLEAEVTDIDSWWGEYYKEVKRLLDARSFVSDCQAKGFNPLNVAEHVVFCSKKKMDEVLYNGIDAVFGNDVLFFRGRLTPKSARINELRKRCIPLLWDGFKDEATAEDAEDPAKEDAAK